MPSHRIPAYRRQPGKSRDRGYVRLNGQRLYLGTYDSPAGVLRKSGPVPEEQVYEADNRGRDAIGMAIGSGFWYRAGL